MIRKRYQTTIRTSGIDDTKYFHVPSLSSRTLTYKGMLTPPQVREYFPDLDDPRTEKVVGEPRVDNAKLLRYADALAYDKVKEFDFPHKRSALMHCWRDPFFDRVLR